MKHPLGLHADSSRSQLQNHMENNNLIISYFSLWAFSLPVFRASAFFLGPTWHLAVFRGRVCQEDLGRYSGYPETIILSISVCGIQACSSQTSLGLLLAFNTLWPTVPMILIWKN